MSDRDEIARQYGFDSFAELLDISHPLPKRPSDEVQSYVARHPAGHWFVWEDKPSAKSATDQRH